MLAARSNKSHSRKFGSSRSASSSIDVVNSGRSCVPPDMRWRRGERTLCLCSIFLDLRLHGAPGCSSNGHCGSPFPVSRAQFERSALPGEYAQRVYLEPLQERLIQRWFVVRSLPSQSTATARMIMYHHVKKLMYTVRVDEPDPVRQHAARAVRRRQRRARRRHAVLHPGAQLRGRRSEKTC